MIRRPSFRWSGSWRSAATSRLAAGITALLSVHACSSPALAAPGDACVSGFEGGQEAKKQNKPLKARAELRLCVGACPELLAAECRTWLAEVEGQIGRVAFSVKGPGGRAVEAAAIQIDGEPAVGAKVEVEPGAHVVAVAAAGYQPVQRTIDVGAGATVPLEILLSPLPPPPPPPPPEGSRMPFVIGFGAAGIAGLLAGSGLVVFGKVEEGRLARTCSPRCDPGDVAVVEQVWIGGGVGLGVGAALTATALSLWLTSPSKNTPRVAWRGWVDPAGGAGGSFRAEF